jgi:hypothetical protein
VQRAGAYVKDAQKRHSAAQRSTSLPSPKTTKFTFNETIRPLISPPYIIVHASSSSRKKATNCRIHVTR